MIRKFVPLIFFNYELIFDLIRVLNSCVYKKTLLAIFEKKPSIETIFKLIHLECPQIIPREFGRHRSQLNFRVLLPHYTMKIGLYALENSRDKQEK